MLQLPDFKEKQIVFIGFDENEKISTLRVKNENLVVSDKDGKILNQVSCSKLFTVFVAGNFTITSNLIKKLLSYGVSMFFMSKLSFRVYADIGAVADGNYLLRENQYEFANDLMFAKNLVLNKISNQLSLLKEVKSKFFKKKSKTICLKEFKAKIDSADSMDKLLGIEGSFSKIYFGRLFEDYNWYKRLPRTKMDINNLLLDIGYTFLFNFIDSLLRLHGFDTYKGIYHQLFFQRKSLVCDLVEPFRCLIDKSLFKAYRLKQVDIKDFKKTKSGYLLCSDKQKKYLKLFAQGIMDDKEDIFKYVKQFYFCILNRTDDFPVFKYKIIC